MIVFTSIIWTNLKIKFHCCILSVVNFHEILNCQFQVGRLTLDEVVDQLSKGGAGKDGPAPAIERLGIPPYQWNTECLRGYGDAGDATCFPSPIGLAATFE